MSSMEIMTMAVSITSLIIAAFAIYLSIQFFKMSSKVSEDTKEAANEIKASIRELDALFRQQHGETFSMAKTAFDEFRKRAFSEKATEEKKNERIDDIRSEIIKEMETKISELGRKAKSTDVELSAIKNTMEELLRKAITESREAEKGVELEVLKDKILTVLLEIWRQRPNLRVTQGFLLVHIKEASPAKMQSALILLETEGLIKIDRSDIHFEISLTKKGELKAVAIESRIYGVEEVGRF